LVCSRAQFLALQGSLEAELELADAVPLQVEVPAQPLAIRASNGGPEHLGWFGVGGR
jgi:hypothetical protein